MAIMPMDRVLQEDVCEVLRSPECRCRHEHKGDEQDEDDEDALAARGSGGAFSNGFRPESCPTAPGRWGRARDRATISSGWTSAVPR